LLNKLNQKNLKKSKKKKLTPQERRQKLNEDGSDSSSSDDDSDDSKSSSSSDSSSDITDSAVAVLHNSIEKTADRRNNRSKYLKDNGYKVTSNSERDYKIKNKLNYSSEAHNSVGGSDYLNSMRNRDRSG